MTRGGSRLSQSQGFLLELRRAGGAEGHPNTKDETQPNPGTKPLPSRTYLSALHPTTFHRRDGNAITPTSEVRLQGVRDTSAVTQQVQVENGASAPSTRAFSNSDRGQRGGRAWLGDARSGPAVPSLSTSADLCQCLSSPDGLRHQHNNTTRNTTSQWREPAGGPGVDFRMCPLLCDCGTRSAVRSLLSLWE